jgi:hypothetical protein
MNYEGQGRKLGTGVKVLRRMARQRAQQRSAQPGTVPTSTAPQNPETKRQPAEVGRAAGEGARRFGKAVAGPVVKTGHVLWLEITGCSFAFFALGFGVEAWRIRANWQAGVEHRHFVAYVAFAVVFLYFSATSFLRARRRSKR